MRFKKPVLRLALDEGVPNSVGYAFREAGHNVSFINESDMRASSDTLIWAFAYLNNRVLVALDGDMKQIAKNCGMTNSQYKNLSLIKLSCSETSAAARIKLAMTLIEHEWYVGSQGDGRRLFVDIGDSLIRTHR